MRGLERIGSSRLGTWFFVTAGTRLDSLLLRLSRGRVSSVATQPVLALQTRGAKSGLQRTTPVIFLEDGDRFVVVASNGGRPQLPAWYHNLKAHPEAAITVAGQQVAVRARVAEAEERERLWRLAVSRFRGYEIYQKRRGDRPIPLVVLEPQDSPA